MRFAFLQLGMTGHQDASLRALAARGHDLLNIFPDGYENSAFDVEQFSEYAQNLRFSGEPPEAEVMETVQAFAPDVVMMAGWSGRSYRKVMGAMEGRALRILFSSSVWQSTRRQWMGRLTHRWYLDPLYDCVMVPGDRSEWFARRLGFTAADVIRAPNPADAAIFRHGPRSGAELASRRTFLFSGRLMEYKGVSVLTEAYRTYREAVADPWDLSVVGVGPLGAQLEALPGVRMHGFVEPGRLAALMHESSCLVLPSFMDFFGVVVHEAALAGLPMICSDQVGATPYLLQDGYNGWTAEAGDVATLREALVRMSTVSEDRLFAMSEGSRNLAQRQSPELWARHLEEEAERRVQALGRPHALRS